MADQQAARRLLLSNHGQLLLTLIENPDQRVKALADQLEAREKTVQRCLTDLEAAGAVRRVKRGNRTVYDVRGADRFDPTAGSLLDFVSLLAPP